MASTGGTKSTPVKSLTTLARTVWRSRANASPEAQPDCPGMPGFMFGAGRDAVMLAPRAQAIPRIARSGAGAIPPEC